MFQTETNEQSKTKQNENNYGNDDGVRIPLITFIFYVYFLYDVKTGKGGLYLHNNHDFAFQVFSSSIALKK